MGLFSRDVDVATLMAFFLSPEDQTESRVYKAIVQRGKEFGPIFKDLSEYFTQLDIDAIKTMMEAGLTQEQAVALRINLNTSIGSGLKKQVSK